MEKPKQYSNFRLKQIVEEFVHSERDRKILVRKYCDNRTIEQLSEEFELSVSQIKRIIIKGGVMVFRIMAEDDPKES